MPISVNEQVQLGEQLCMHNSQLTIVLPEPLSCIDLRDKEHKHSSRHTPFVTHVFNTSR